MVVEREEIDPVQPVMAKQENHNETSKMNSSLSKSDHYSKTEGEFKTSLKENEGNYRNPAPTVHQILSDKGHIPIELNSESPIILRVVNNLTVGTGPVLEDEQEHYIFSYFRVSFSHTKENCHFKIQKEEEEGSTPKSIFNHHNSQDTSDPNTVEEFKYVTIEKSFLQSLVSVDNNTSYIEETVSDTLNKCKTCGKCFSTKGNLKQHYRNHTGEKPFMCMICGMCFVTKPACGTHTRAHTGEKPHQCDKCGKFFSSKGNLVQHSILHNPRLKEHTCETCGKSFPLKSTLYKHINKVHKTHTCDTCGKCFTSYSIFTDHKYFHTGEKPFDCKTCGKCFIRNERLTIHRMRCHIEEMCKCEICGKIFLSEPLLNVHMKFHTGENLHKCETCGDWFYSITSMMKHSKVHVRPESEPELQSYSCETITLKSSMDDHKASSHTVRKPESHMCETCGKIFVRKAKLTRHRKTHAPLEKPPVCEICGKYFTRYSYLAEHRRSHTGEKPFKCELCGKYFSSKCILRHHVKIHTGAHKCEICGLHFRTKSLLEIHSKLHTNT